MQKLFVSLGFAALVAGAVTTHAALFLYEPFNYTNGTLVGQLATGVGENTSSNWFRYNDTEEYYNNIGTGLSYGLLMSAHGSLALSNGNTGAFAYYGIELTPSAYTNWTTPANGTSREIWVSFLYRTPSTLNDVTRLGWARSANEAQMFGVEIQGSSARAFLSGASTLGLTLAPSTTYFGLLQLTGNMTGGVRTYTNVLWLFSGGVLPSNLGDLASVPSVTNTSTSANFFDTQWVMWTRTRGTSAAATQFATFDEIRMGNTFDDVVVVIPEPSTALLVGLGLMGVLALRRRKN